MDRDDLWISPRRQTIVRIPIIVRIPRGEGGTYPGKRWGWTPTLSFQFKARICRFLTNNFWHGFVNFSMFLEESQFDNSWPIFEDFRWFLLNSRVQIRNFTQLCRFFCGKKTVIRPLSAWNLVVTKLLYCILSSTPLFHHQGGVDIAGWGWFCQGGVNFFRVGLIFSGWGWRSSSFHKHEIANELALSIHQITDWLTFIFCTVVQLKLFFVQI